MAEQGKGLEGRFISKIVGLYLRLMEESWDEGQSTQKVHSAIRTALGKLGIALSADVLEEKARKIADAAIREGKNALERKYLLHVTMGEGSASYPLAFLPGLQIPNTPENKAKWTEFIGTLAAKTRVGEDPKTKHIGILWRDGAWLGNLILASDVKTLFLTEDIQVVERDLVAANARVINKSFTHPVEVKGELHLNNDLLRQVPPPLTLGQGMTLLGVRTVEQAAFTPQMLVNWGMKDGMSFTVRSNVYTFRARDKGPFIEYLLEGRNVLTSYEWISDKWLLTRKVRISPELFNELHGALSRMCIRLGLGADFVVKNDRKLEENVDKLSLYLGWALRFSAAPDQPAAVQGKTAAEALAGDLERIRSLLFGPGLDEALLARQASANRDSLLDSAAAFGAMPRHKVPEKDIQKDIAFLAKLVDGRADANDLLLDGRRTASFLYTTFAAGESRGRTLAALRSLAEAWFTLAEVPEENELASFGEFLADPEAALARIDSPDDQGAAKVREEVRVLAGTAPKQVIRQIVNVQVNSESPEYADDQALLRDLFAMQKSGLEHLPLTSLRMLDLLAPTLVSALGLDLPLLRQAMAGQAKSPTRLAELAEALREASPTDLAARLRAEAELRLDVARKYNALTTVPPEDAGKEEDKAPPPREELPPNLVYGIMNKLNRLCLVLNLGKAFLEQHSGAIPDNVAKIRAYFNLALGDTEFKVTSILLPSDADVVREARDNLAVLSSPPPGREGEEAVANVLSRFEDDTLRKLQAILAKPRHLVDEEDVKRDLTTLRTIGDPSLNLERVFGSPGRALLFLNSAFESKELKRAVSHYIKPLYFPLMNLAKAHPELADMTTHLLLRRPERSLETLEQVEQTPDTREELRNLKHSLRVLSEKSILEILSQIKHSQFKEQSEEFLRDMDLMEKLTMFDKAPIGNLELNPKQTSLLLLLLLDSFITQDVKNYFESGELAKKTSKQIIDALHDKLKWRHAIIRAYNKLTTPAPRQARER
ncbi:MAG: hypothetical protein AB1916_08270 [Thermodesulfobacteriota bacterium]